MVQGQRGQKLVRYYLKNKLGMVFHNCNTSYLGGGFSGSWPKAGLGKSTRPYLKIKIKQRVWGMGQVVEHLPSKNEALERKREGGREERREKWREGGRKKSK
jgi:hypothetical protein